MGLRVLPDWQAFHFFYHGSRDHLILNLVKPLVEDLWRDRLIDHFFFIRYSLGGPHVRLRLKPCEGGEDAIRQRVDARAARFFEDHPSLESLDLETIQKINTSVLRNDSDQDERCFADNSVEAFPFQAEVPRYGGTELLPHSLELFTVSSLASLSFLEAFHQAPAGRRLPAALTVMINQALGLARDGEELLAMSRYAEEWSASYALLVQRGDEAFERSSAGFVRLLETRLSSDSEERFGSGASLFQASKALSEAIVSADEKKLHDIKISHLHMTANRLGVTNAEEVYLGRILSRSIEALQGRSPEIFERGLAGALTDNLGILSRQAMDSSLSAHS